MTKELHNPLTYISLFSGCGGFDIGFKNNGATCLGAYDIDPYVLEVHKKNLGSPTYIHDLNDYNLPGNLPKEIDIVIAGSPCQGFSTIGKREIDDPRNHLLLTGGQIAIKYNAKAFVCENVLGSMSGEHNKYWKQLIDLLQVKGYKHKMIKYCASDFGIPQTRKRIILYAWQGNEIDESVFKLDTISKVVLSDVLNLNGTTSNHNLDYIEIDTDEYKIALHIKQGQKLCNVRNSERSIHTWDIPEVFGKATKEEKRLLLILMKLRRQIRRRDNGDADPVDEKFLKDYFGDQTNKIIKNLIAKKYIKRVDKRFVELTNTFNGKFKRLNMLQLSPTVDTRFGSYRYFLHPTEARGFSVREAARIQGFDDNFIFYGPINKQYEMIGNAVPPPLAYFIAKKVKENLIKFL